MIFYNGKDSKIIKAVSIANDLLNGANSFYLNIEHREKFELSNITNKQIVLDMKYVHRVYEIEYKGYRPFYCRSKVVGYYSSKTPNIIFYNKIKAKRLDIEDIVGNIIHEFIHATDYRNGSDRNHHHKTKHNPNSRKGKENTAPYWIGYLARDICVGKYL